MVRTLFFILLFTAVSFAQDDFRVKAFTDTTSYLVGDYIKLTYQIEHKKGISFAELSFRDSIKNIDIINIGTPREKEENGNVITEYVITLSRYDSSDIKIDPITFFYWYGKKNDRAAFLTNYDPSKDSTLKSAKSNEVNFRVNAVKVNVQEEIKDIKQPLKLPPDWRLILLYIFIVLVIAGAGYYFYRKIQVKRRANAGYVEIIIPPDEAALNALKELEKKNLWQKGQIKEFHSEVTGIIRKYFQDRFGFPALELTTGETLELLNKKKDAKQIIEETADFLSKADLVKFAKFIPMNDVNEMMLKRAYDIVELTRPALTGAQEESSVQ